MRGTNRLIVDDRKPPMKNTPIDRRNSCVAGSGEAVAVTIVTLLGEGELATDEGFSPTEVDIDVG